MKKEFFSHNLPGEQTGNGFVSTATFRCGQLVFLYCNAILKANGKTE